MAEGISRDTPLGRLSVKEHQFCLEYLKDLNMTHAAIRAGYSPKGAGVTGSQVRNRPRVAAAIDHVLKAREARTEITVDRVLKEYAKLAFLDIRKAFDKNGDLKPIHELDDDTAAAVAGIDFEEIYAYEGKTKSATGKIHKIKLADKKGALDSLGRHLGMFVDKTELTGKDGGPLAVSVLDNVAERVRQAKLNREQGDSTTD